MAPAPNKSRMFHKSSGKPPRHKERERSNGNGSSGNPETSTSNGSGMTLIRKDDILELQDVPLTLPEAMTISQIKSLPRYCDLSKGVCLPLDELDFLQLELELLLSSVFVRDLSFSHQSGITDHLEKGRLPPREPSSPGKRSGSELERPTKRLKDIGGKPRDVIVTPTTAAAPKISKVKCSVVQNEAHFDVPDLGPQEPTRMFPVKNDMINRFWQMVNQYCQEITADDMKGLEEMINTQNEDNDYLKIPPLGKHYTLRWAQEDLVDEQKEGAKSGEKRKIKQEPGTEGCDKFLREVDMNGCSDDVAPLGPLTQRVISGLVEENVLMSENIENKVQGIGVGRPGFIRNLHLGNPASLEKRIKKELQDQGIIEPDSCNEDEDDEILCEIKKCQSDLKAITAHNQVQLNRLLRQSREALVRHDLKKRLSDVDAKVVEAHRAIAAAKQKKKIPLKKEKEAAWRLLKEREAIVKQLDAITQI